MQKFEYLFIRHSYEILEFENVDPFAEKTLYSVLKPIFKCSKYPSILAINNVTNESTFRFSCVRTDDIFKGILSGLRQF